MYFGWINLFNLIIIGIMLIPNVMYAVRNKNAMNKCTNRLMNLLEQVGRYGCIVFMLLPIGMESFGFGSILAFLIYLFSVPLFLCIYLMLWRSEFSEPTTGAEMALSIIPVLIFLLCGITMSHYLLIAAAIILTISHPYVTWQNAK